MSRRFAMVALAASVASGACAGDPQGTVTVTLGEEGDALSRAPAPATLVVEALGLDRSKKELSRTSLPADEISLGDLPRTDVGAIALTAVDPTGKVLLRGESLYLQWGALEDQNLDVFLHRTGELARPPRGPNAFDARLALVAFGRYVLAANETTTFLYDLLNLRLLDSAPVLPRPARSLVTYDTVALVVDEQGASLFDLQTRQTNAIDPPAGATFGEVAGGATVRASDGTQFIVGATRAPGGAGPTARILRIDVDGNLTAVSLANAREGACAAWVDGRGLVVYGGSATAPGGEVIAPNATQSSPLPFPPDDVRGCGAAALDGSHVLVASKGAKVLDLACAADCKPGAWPDPAIDLARAEAFTLAADAALVVGDDAGGNTKAFRVSAGAPPREIALKAARRGAHLVSLPQNGMAAVVGGNAPGLEYYAE